HSCPTRRSSDLREKDALLAEGAAAGKRLPKDSGIQRYKGLGEMNEQELWDTTMNPDTRTLRQVTVGEAAAADEIFSVLMGEDVESRREFIQRNARDVRFLDISSACTARSQSPDRRTTVTQPPPDHLE